MRLLFCLLMVVLAGCAAGGGAAPGADATSPPPAEPPPPGSRESGGMIVTPSGLQYEDLRVGDGAIAETGLEVLVHYTGWFTDGRKFDSSHDRGQPYPFRLGRGVVIRGWDEGLQGMRVGGRRKLIVPPHLGYGATGDRNGVIPPNATLVFEVELFDVR